MNAVSLKGVSKKYKIYDNARARIKEYLLMGRKKCHKDFWALRDISFDVPAGQSLGIVGNNGAGKSTLLKLLAGVSSPTEGEITINGRVSALLELGAGFHPEFTGRDNIYMNAALLGLEREFIDERFAEIVAFSELGEFIDMPIKFYSSGMVVRLGFSVAISVSPEILIIDEALAVGDIGFQRKCMKKMREFRDNGVTILLVTHSLGGVGAFCDRVLLMKEGRITLDSDPETVIGMYHKEMQSRELEAQSGTKRFNPLKDEIATSHNIGKVKIENVEFLTPDGSPAGEVKTGEGFVVRVSYNALEKVRNPLFRVEFFKSDGLFVCGTNTYRQGVDLGEVEGPGSVEVEFPDFSLLGGRYYVSVEISPDEYSSHTANIAYDKHDMAYELFVKSLPEHGGGLVYNESHWRKVKG